MGTKSTEPSLFCAKLFIWRWYVASEVWVNQIKWVSTKVYLVLNLVFVLLCFCAKLYFNTKCVHTILHAVSADHVDVRSEKNVRDIIALHKFKHCKPNICSLLFLQRLTILICVSFLQTNPTYCSLVCTALLGHTQNKFCLLILPELIPWSSKACISRHFTHIVLSILIWHPSACSMTV